MSQQEIQIIHESSLKLLNDIGINVDSPELRSILQENGAEIDEENQFVKFPNSLIKKQLEKVPDSFFLYGPDDGFKVNIDLNSTIFATQGAPNKIYDEMNPIQPREASLSDLVKFLQISDSLEYLSCSHLDIWPMDIPYITLHCHGIREWAKNSNKPFGIGCRGKIMSKDIMELISIIVNGKQELIKKPRIIGFFNPLSPLTLPRVLLGGLFTFSQYKQPLIIAPAASGGLNAPITLAGLLTQTNAEVLSSIVLTQLIQPGTPVLYGSVNTPIDPRTGNVAWGSIETGLITIATAQLARFYKIPSRASGCITNSNLLDMQNGFERFITLSAAANAGINYITCAGTYECGLSSSLELLIVDNELAGIISRGLEGIRVNEETIALDQIKKVALGHKQGTHFLNLHHTALNAKKELFIPSLSERNTRGTWLRKGALNFIDKAKLKVKEILKHYEQHILDPEVEKKIDDYIKKVKKRNINEYLMQK